MASTIIGVGNMVRTLTSGDGDKIGTQASSDYGWHDLLGPITPKAAGAGSPTRTAYSGAIFDYAFALNDVADINFHMLHDYAPSTNMFIHVHWSHNGTNISGSAVFTFALQYAKGHNQANFGGEIAPVITYATVDLATTPQYRHRIDEVQFTQAGADATHFAVANMEVDGMILGLLKVTTLPTITAGSLFIHTVDLHYQSTNMATKNKAPNFYT